MFKKSARSRKMLREGNSFRSRKFARRLNESVLENHPRVLVNTYSLQDEGNEEGIWYDLSDFGTKEDFFRKVIEDFRNIDPNPELDESDFIFPDYENCGDLVDEDSIDDDLWENMETYKDFEDTMSFESFLEALDNYINYDWLPLDVYLKICDEYDSPDNLFIVKGQYSYASEDTDLGDSYIDSLGGISALSKDTLESYFDSERFGHDLGYDFYCYESSDGTRYFVQG